VGIFAVIGQGVKAFRKLWGWEEFREGGEGMKMVEKETLIECSSIKCDQSVGSGGGGVGERA